MTLSARMRLPRPVDRLAAFRDLLADTDGPVLDCGAGGRRHPRVISLEYVDHPGNDIRADGQALPFRSDSFALVLSQAVIEHVPNPQAYANEIVRVLRPGGLVWIEGAFLQPVHQAPAHYFNVTPFGLAHLFREIEVVEQCQIGSMRDWWRWMAVETGATRHLTANQLATMEVAMRTLDASMTPVERWNVSSGVGLLGRKP